MTTIRLVIAAFVFASGVAVADSRPDPHAEMAAALAAQIDDHPAPVRLPSARALPHGNTNQLNGPNAHASANGQLHGGEGQANALEHQAEAAANAAVGQQRSQDAKSRMHGNSGK